MPNSRHTSLMPSPSRRRATMGGRSSVTEHSFHGIDTSRQMAKSATHVAGTFCHLSLRPESAVGTAWRVTPWGTCAWHDCCSLKRNLARGLADKKTLRWRAGGEWRAAPLTAFLAEDQIASLSSLEARKATFLLALIWIGWPVAGLRPMRAG